MDILEIEQLNQLVSRKDMSGNEKVKWLLNFIEKREQVLIQNNFRDMFSCEKLAEAYNDGVLDAEGGMLEFDIENYR